MGHLLQRISSELVQVEYPQTYKIWLLGSQNRGLIFFFLQIFSTVPLTNTDKVLEVLCGFKPAWLILLQH